MELTTADLEVITNHILTRLTRNKQGITIPKPINEEVIKSNRDLEGPVHKRAKLTVKNIRAQVNGNGVGYVAMAKKHQMSEADEEARRNKKKKIQVINNLV